MGVIPVLRVDAAGIVLDILDMEYQLPVWVTEAGMKDCFRHGYVLTADQPWAVRPPLSRQRWADTGIMRTKTSPIPLARLPGHCLTAKGSDEASPRFSAQTDEE